MEPTKILIADDHPIVLEGVSNLLKNEKDLEIVGVAHNGLEAIKILQSGKVIDIAILDIDMEPMNGIDVTRRIREDGMNIKVLILSMFGKRDQLDTLMELDIDGYILKGGEGIKELLAAVRTISNGGQYFGRQIVEKVFEARRNELRKPKKPQIILTKREKQIAGLFAKSLNAPMIADKLCLSTYTVETHRKNIYTKLGINSNAQLVRYAIENGIDQDILD